MAKIMGFYWFLLVVFILLVLNIFLNKFFNGFFFLLNSYLNVVLLEIVKYVDFEIIWVFFCSIYFWIMND